MEQAPPTFLDKYHKPVNIDGKRFIAFIDRGSDVVTMREDAAQKHEIKFNSSIKTLRGFGNGLTQTIGRRYLLLTVEDADIDAEVLIVPNDAQEEDMILGRSALDQPGIKIIKTERKLEISKMENENTTEISNEVQDVKKLKVERNPSVTLLPKKKSITVPPKKIDVCGEPACPPNKSVSISPKTKGTYESPCDSLKKQVVCTPWKKTGRLGKESYLPFAEEKHGKA